MKSRDFIIFFTIVALFISFAVLMNSEKARGLDITSDCTVIDDGGLEPGYTFTFGVSDSSNKSFPAFIIDTDGTTICSVTY